MNTPDAIEPFVEGAGDVLAANVAGHSVLYWAGAGALIIGGIAVARWGIGKAFGSGQ